MNIAISITDRSKTNTRWPLPAWSRWIDKETCKRKIHHRFADWDDEAVEVIDVRNASAFGHLAEGVKVLLYCVFYFFTHQGN